MAQQVSALAGHDSLSFLSVTMWQERTSSHKLSSDHHKCTVACTREQTHAYICVVFVMV